MSENPFGAAANLTASGGDVTIYRLGKLIDDGVGIQPKDLPPELSRGHPMGYVFLNAVVAKSVGVDDASH